MLSAGRYSFFVSSDWLVVCLCRPETRVQGQVPSSFSQIMSRVSSPLRLDHHHHHHPITTTAYHTHFVYFHAITIPKSRLLWKEDNSASISSPAAAHSSSLHPSHCPPLPPGSVGIGNFCQFSACPFTPTQNTFSANEKRNKQQYVVLFGKPLFVHFYTMFCLMFSFLCKFYKWICTLYIRVAAGNDPKTPDLFLTNLDSVIRPDSTQPYATLPYPTLPYPILSYPTLPPPTRPDLTQPYANDPTLPYGTLPDPTLPDDPS